ncbi:hypothetical protein [Burkholderia ubonensis]|uniref:hypothetical protein n=1 Tax=Burkholderia ubonensis TaxID=101571 RepID=UPI0012FAFA08|nr:hypothetical protein [Burkholderia ubonensis]
MKKAIGWLAAWALFWMGHVVSRSMERFDWAVYPLYTRLMLASVGVQDWAGVTGPWEQRHGR